ncbi:hypothetical protein THAOC_06080 [Thalassiosira oceanica]|uniref:Uncharacterized protein n=1 Tax=Thalassiosira oceanica TaxID=159749 RepID=K0T5I5_THAOC|nr:hypothetical protein THAOC_06080 [Thalassiosira oceanica]|eukprot:EJK72394.1 hypothetical protein THAOC_06080 [Thalassiosira oceanica]
MDWTFSRSSALQKLERRRELSEGGAAKLLQPRGGTSRGSGSGGTVVVRRLRRFCVIAVLLLATRRFSPPPDLYAGPESQLETPHDEEPLVLVHLGKTAGSTLTCMMGLDGSGKGDSRCQPSDFRPSAIARAAVGRVHLEPAPVDEHDGFVVTLRNPERHVRGCANYREFFECYGSIQSLSEDGLSPERGEKGQRRALPEAGVGHGHGRQRVLAVGRAGQAPPHHVAGGGGQHPLPQRRDYERAAEKYALCLTIDNDGGPYNLNALAPLHAVLHFNRAACLMALKKYREAVKDCTAALRIHTHYMKAILRRGRCFARIRQYQEAIADYERYIRLVLEARKSPQSAVRSNAACTFDRPIDVTEGEYSKARQELADVRKSMRQASSPSAVLRRWPSGGRCSRPSSTRAPTRTPQL